jgi:hypothetical protein
MASSVAATEERNSLLLSTGLAAQKMEKDIGLIKSTIFKKRHGYGEQRCLVKPFCWKMKS